MGGGASERRDGYSWITALFLAACGPDVPDATATDATTTATSSTSSTSSTLGESSTTGALSCLQPPMIGDLWAASLEGCTPPPTIDAGLEVEVAGWPEAITDESGAGEGSIDAQCEVVAITGGEAPIDLDLDCGDESPPVALRILHEAQQFPVCVGHTVDLRYTRVEIGIPNGGGGERLELRRPSDDALLAASYRRYSADAPGEPAFDPFAFAASDLGCPTEGDACTSTRAGFSITADDATWTVPDRGLRLLPSAPPYVAFVADASESGGGSDTCESFTSWGLDLTRPVL